MSKGLNSRALSDPLAQEKGALIFAPYQGNVDFQPKNLANLKPIPYICLDQCVCSNRC